MSFLKFIDDENLSVAVIKVIKSIELAENEADLKLYSRVIDPFSALFDGITNRLDFDKWLKVEKLRQTQKTMQNAIGTFHQDIIGSSYGWENFGHGGGLDVLNKEKKIVAEIKNKYNTTKGNHKVAIYDDIKEMLKNEDFKDYTGYYVEIIPNLGKKYDEPFTPSDNKIKNKNKKRRPTNKKIRRIDGKSFYYIVTGRKNALQELFEVLPQVINESFTYKLKESETKKYFQLFRKAYSSE